MSDAYEKRVRKDNWGNFSILRHRAFDGVLVTSKNSGTHWVKYMFAVALAETYGVPRPQYFSEDAVRPYIGWPKDKPTFPELPRLAFSHTIPHKLADWSFARGLAGLVAVDAEVAVQLLHLGKEVGGVGGTPARIEHDIYGAGADAVRPCCKDRPR